MRLDGALDRCKSTQAIFDPWARKSDQEDPLACKPTVKHQLSEVFVVRYENPFLAAGIFKQDFIRLARQ
jgi:hypothetical protein